MKFLTTLLILLGTANAFAQPSFVQPVDSWKMGKAASGADKVLTFDIGAGSANPKLRYHVATGKLQTANDGATFSDLGSGGGLPPVVLTTDATLAPGNRYIVNDASMADLTLPASCAVGDEISIIGVGAGGWKLTTNASAASQKLNIGASTSQISSSSALDILFSDSINDAIHMVCVTANSVWNALNNIGTSFGIITASCSSCSIATSGDFKIATFNANDTLVVSAGTGNVQYFMIGGGGSSDNAGNQFGGGGGGVPLAGTKVLGVGSYTVTIGAGGTAGASSNPGSSTVFGSLSTPGGAGGLAAPSAGNISSGGTGGSSGSFIGGLGNGTAGTFQVTGGGAGAATNGQDAPAPSQAGNGGNGVTTTITGSTLTFGGGGGGGSNGSGSAGTGGTGGGGNGGVTGVTNAQNGTANTGGGGGAMGNTGNGGSGKVIAKWKFQ